MITADHHFNLEDPFTKRPDKCTDTAMCFNKRIHPLKDSSLENYRHAEKKFLKYQNMFGYQIIEKHL